MLLSTDWLAKRFCKWLLKNHLGGLLRSEVDLQQLDVQLGKGTLELRNVLLNCAYLNQQLASDAWEVSAGYVGCMRIVIPFTNLYSEPCSLHLDETLITLRPKQTGSERKPSADSPSDPGGVASEGFSPSGLDAPVDANSNGQMGIVDGVQLIAGGLENVLQRLRVHGSNATVRVEVPGPHEAVPVSLVVVRVDELSYSGEGVGTTAANPPPGVQLRKHVSFSGLTAELFEDVEDELAPSQPDEHMLDESADAESADSESAGAGASDAVPAGTKHNEGVEASALLPDMPNDDTSHIVVCSSAGAGCSGKLQLLLTWPHAAQLHPSIDATLAVDPLQVQLQPHHLVLLSRLSHVLSRPLSEPSSAASPPASAPDPGNVARPVAEARSFIEGMFLPDTTGLAQEFMSQSWRMPTDDSSPANESTPQTDDTASVMATSTYEDFFNARSFMGSMQSSVSSFVSATAQALKNSDALSASSNRLASMLGPREDDSAGMTQPASPSFQLGLSLPELSLVLWYPVDDESAADDLAEYRPRFSAECAELGFRVTSSADKATAASLHIARMEAVEHLPCVSATAAEMRTLAQVTKVPEVLPTTVAGHRPVPTFAGVSIVPLRRSLYSSTLSQLALSASFAAPADQGPTVQIWPVLSCLGASHTAGGVPCLAASLQLPDPTARPSRVFRSPKPSATSTAEVRLRPVTAWVSMALLQRLADFFKPLSVSLVQDQRQLQEASPVASAAPVPFASPQRTEVARAIDSILDDLQEMNPGADSDSAHRKRAQQSATASLSFQARLAAPHVTLVAVLPPTAQGTPVCHGYTFAAVDIFAVPAAPQDPAAGIPLVALAPANPSPGEETLSAGAWDAESAIGRAKVYLVGNPFTVDSASDGADELMAKCIVDVTPKPSPTANPVHHPGLGLADPSRRTALTLTARVQPHAATSAEMTHQAWAHAKAQQSRGKGADEADAQLQEMQLQEAVHASSHARIFLHADHAHLDLNRADLAAICHLRESFASWQQAQASAADSYGEPSCAEGLAAQVAFEVEACVHAQLRAPSQAHADVPGDESSFTLEAHTLTLASVSGLGGSADACSLSVTAKGLSLTEDHGGACLLHVPSSSPKAGLCFRQVQRPRDLMASVMGDWGATLSPLEALADVSIRGATLAAGHANPSLPWLNPIAELFAPCSYASGPEGFQPPSTSWSAHLQDCALRYEAPAEELPGAFLEASQAVAAAVLIAHARWHLHAGHPDQRVEAGGVSVWCARGEYPFGVTQPVDMPSQRLMSSGYTCLAQEGGVSIAIHPADNHNGLSEVEITNERLRCFLTRSDLHTVQALAAQLSAVLSVSTPSTDSLGGDVPLQGEGAWDPGEPLASQGVPTGVARVMDGLQEDAFSGGGARAEPHASVFLNGGWYAANDVPLMENSLSAADEEGSVGSMSTSVPEGAPEVREGYMVADLQGCDEESAEADIDDAELEARGFWYGDESEQERDLGEAEGPSNLDEGYVQVPANPRHPQTNSSPLAFQPLASHYPAPLSRVTLREANVCIALCSEPADSYSQEEGVPTRAPRVELELSGVSARVDSFPPGEMHAKRLTLSIANAELRDCQPGTDRPPSWKKIVARHGLPKGSHEAGTCLFEAALDMVSPSSTHSDQEYRLYLAAVPLRVRLDQHVAGFLHGFFLTPLDAMSQAPQMIEDESSAPEEQLLAAAVAAAERAPYFQRCEIRGGSVTFDYLPRHVDMQALKTGSMLEKLLQLLHLIPLSNLRITLPHLRLAGYKGWQALADAIGLCYMNDMIGQVPKFLTGIRAVRPLIRIGSAAGQLVAIPLELLRNRGFPRLYEGSSRGSHALPPRATASLPMSWQLQRSFIELLKTVVAETLGLSASAMGSLQVVLQGTNLHAQSAPADISTGLQQASSHISAGFSSRGPSPPTSEQLLEGSIRSASNPTSEPYANAGGYGSSAVRFLRATPGAIVAPIGATAAAARCALLGARNSLDPRHYEERRQSDA